MNKAAAIGFAAGLVFLAGLLVFNGGGMPPAKTAVAEKARAALGTAAVAVNEESAESDSGTKTTDRKLLPFKTPGSEALPKPEPKGQGLVMARSVTPGGYRVGQALDVIVSFSNESADKVTALALVERLPKGWSFEAVSGGAKPVIMPAKGAAGELTFVWVQVPPFPCTLSYRILAAPEVTGPQELQGQAVYRQLGPEQRTEMVKTVTNAAP